VTKSSSLIDIFVGYNNKLFTSTSNTKFLGIGSENSLSWKAHIDQLIPKLCTACYAIRASKPFMFQGTGKLVYCSYSHSLMNCGIIFWRNSSQSIHVFRPQKRVIRIITRSRPRDYCRELFKNIKDFTVSIAIYIFTLTICSQQ